MSNSAFEFDHLHIYHGDLRTKGVRFPVALKEGVGGRLLCYVSAPNGVSIELMQDRPLADPTPHRPQEGVA